MQPPDFDKVNVSQGALSEDLKEKGFDQEAFVKAILGNKAVKKMKEPDEYDKMRIEKAVAKRNRRARRNMELTQ